jgi:hypothetical protein
MCLARRKLWIARIVTLALSNRVTGGSCGKLSFGCFLRIRHIYPASPLSLTADSAHSVRVSDRAERHSRELPSGLIQSSLRTLPRIRRRLQHDRAHQLMPDSPSGSRFRHGYGRTSFPGSEVALCTAMLGRVAFLDLSVAKGSLRFVDQSLRREANIEVVELSRANTNLTNRPGPFDPSTGRRLSFTNY